MRILLWVMLGGAFGSGARHLANLWVTTQFPSRLPWGTIAINVAGSFVIGLFAATCSGTGRWPVSEEARQFFIAGCLGGFTTFSAFSLQTLTLAREHAWGLALANILLSLVLCLGGVALGHLAGAALNRGG